MQELYEQLKKYGKLNDETIKRIEMVAEAITFKKKEIVVRQGRPSPYVYFILKGVLHTFSTNGDGITVSWIQKENSFVISIGAYFEQKPAKGSIQALEPTTCLRMRYQDMIDICRVDPDFAGIVNAIVNHYYDISEDRKNILLQSSMERYLWLMDNDPELLTRVPKEILCKYLGIREGTWNRVGKQARPVRRKKGISGK